jgi:hypothetical protein
MKMNDAEKAILNRIQIGKIRKSNKIDKKITKRKIKIKSLHRPDNF